MNSRLITVIAIALSIPTVAHAEKNISDAEVHAIGHAWKQRCADLAAAENQPSLEKACFDEVKRGAAEIDEIRNDPKIGRAHV